MSAILQDLRYALRTQVKNPAVSVIAVLSLGLGIGATSAAFSIIHALRIGALPYPGADRLVSLVEGSSRRPPEQRATARYDTFRTWEASLRSVRPLAAHWVMTADLATGSEPARQLVGEAVSAHLFEILGVAPSRGRAFGPEDDRPGAEPVVLISHGLWQSLYQGAPEVVGKPLKLSGATWVVLGVMPPGFQFESQSDFWIPLAPYIASSQARGLYGLAAAEVPVRVLGRLAPGAGLTDARAELAAAPPPPPAGDERWSADARSLRADMLMLWGSYDIAFGAVALAVLLIACANLAGLLLVRTLGRQREFAVRTALGASPARIGLQLLSEGLVLAGAGGVLGAVLGRWLIEAVLAHRLTPATLPTAVVSGLGRAALPFAIALSFATAVLVSLAPAFRMARSAPQRFLRGSAMGQSGRSARRLAQRVFVSVQIAAAAILASLAGMGAQTYLRLTTGETGNDPARVLYLRFALPNADGGRSAADLYAPVRERLLAIPGVETVGVQFWNVAARRPLPGYEAPRLTIARSDGNFEMRSSGTSAAAVDPAFFVALRIPLIQGRVFGDHDVAAGPPVAVVNQRAATSWWPGENPLGKRFKFGTASDAGPWISVVGVVGNVKEAVPAAIAEDFRPTAYFPAHQGYGQYVQVFLRPHGPRAETLIAPVRAALHEIAPDRSAFLDTQRGLYRLILDPMEANVAAIFVAAFCGMFLAAIGIYGVLAYAVERRRQEIGLRLALGAGRASVVRLLLREGVGLALAGLAVGLGSALAVLRVVRGIFWGALEADAGMLLLVGGAFLLVTLLASAVPVRRALRVDPIVTLRGE